MLRLARSMDRAAEEAAGMRAPTIGWTRRLPMVLASGLFAMGLVSAGAGAASAATRHGTSHATATPRLVTIALGQYDVLILPPDPCRAACQVIIPGVLALQKESTNPVH
jgi:hypothetical protein